MATFVLIPGAGGVAWYWSRVVPLLEKAGHEAVAVDLPGDDNTVGLDAYAKLVAAAAKGRKVTLVAQSMGGFTAALACALVDVQRLVFLNAMIPKPNETPGAWWGNTGAGQARTEAATRDGYNPEFDLQTYFLHDLPPEVANEGAPYQRGEAEIAFSQPCTFTAWPKVPTQVLVGKGDRFFPPAFQEVVAKDRLGVGIDLVPGGHLAALSYPQEVAAKLLRG